MHHFGGDGGGDAGGREGVTWGPTGNAEAECIGVGGKETFQDRGFPSAGGAGEYDGPVELCC